MKAKDIISYEKAQYSYLQLIPTKSVRNHSTDKIAKTINSLCNDMNGSMRKSEYRIINILGKEIPISTYKIHQQTKVSYYIYIKKNEAEFFFIAPTQYKSVLQDKIRDSWSNITIREVDNIPLLSDKSIKFSLQYAKEDAMSLAVNKTNNDLIGSNLNVMEILKENDKVAILYNFIPCSQFSWRADYKRTLEKYYKGAPIGKKQKVKSLINASLGFAFDLVDMVLDMFSMESKTDNPIDHLKYSLSNETMSKVNQVVIDTQIVLMSESDSVLRSYNNALALSNSFDSVSEDNRLIPIKYNYKVDHKLRDMRCSKNRCSANEISNFLSLPGRELIEEHNIGHIATNETEVAKSLQDGVICVGENTCRGKQTNAYLTNHQEYKYLTHLLVGPTRCGKTNLIAWMCHDALKAGECVVLFDFIGNCELSKAIINALPNVPVTRIHFDDINKVEGMGYNEMVKSMNPFERYKNLKAQSVHFKDLVNSINDSDYPLTSKMKKYLNSAALIVFSQNGTINDVFEVLQDPNTRERFINNIDRDLIQFLESSILNISELDKKSAKTEEIENRSHSISGVIDRLEILKENAHVEMMLSKDLSNNINLVDEFQKNQIIAIQMPETMFSTDGERDTFTTYWLTKIWLAAQVRKSLHEGKREEMVKVNFIVDELYQVKNTEAFLEKIISRAAKFHIKPIISAHYINQLTSIRNELRSANTSYQFISGCDEANYREMKSMMAPFTEEDLLELPEYHAINILKCKEGYSRFITKLPAEFPGLK